MALGVCGNDSVELDSLVDATGVIVSSAHRDNSASGDSVGERGEQVSVVGQRANI